MVRLLNICIDSELMSLEEISEVHYDAINGYSLIANNDVGTRLRLGAGDYALKLQRYNRLRELHPNRMQHVSLVDLVLPERVLVRGFGKGTDA